MPQVRVLSKGARITGGVFCLLFALHTWIWVVRDVVELGMGKAWDLWTGALGPGAAGLTEMPGTTSADLGLGLLQLAAVFAAFTGAWTAGGLMAVTTALTFSYRLPVIWHAALHEEGSPFYAMQGFYNDDALAAAGLTCSLAVLLCIVLGVVLLSGIRPWPRTSTTAMAGPAGAWPPGAPGQPPLPPQPEPPLPSECPQRPTGGHTAVAALFLGVLALYDIGWTIHSLTAGGGRLWVHLFTGEGIVASLMDVSPAWDWLTLIFLGLLGAVLALPRLVSARGFSLGLAIALLPESVTTLWGYVDAGAFFQLEEPAPVLGFFGRLQVVIVLVGSLTLIALAMRPGVPVASGAPAGPAP
ncbi:hypothetical protein, partial [Streptomyces albidus (ex Kaewkla and Franco 2022)]|uniref:hypothetical protein n=1 Tax=Streptomyces albidus (ex Kaewkla and Franco 2022) TaxID=722709 RepID=UPI0015EE6709